MLLLPKPYGSPKRPWLDLFLFYFFFKTTTYLSRGLGKDGLDKDLTDVGFVNGHRGFIQLLKKQIKNQAG